MAKKIAAGGLISLTNLWAKPLPSARNLTKETNATRKTQKMAHEDDAVTDDDDDLDVDAELANADTEENDEEPDYDAEDGDVEDAGQDEIEDDEEVVTAVDDDEHTGGKEKAPTFKEVKKTIMAEKMSLSDHIRAEITRRKNAGESRIRGKDIVESLGKRKITVSPPQVSQLLKKAGLGGAPRAGRPAKATAPAAATNDAEKSRAAMKAKKRVEAPAKPVASPQARQALKARAAAVNGFKVPLAQLQAAEAFVSACGGSFKDAENILTAAAQLSQTFGG